MTNFAYAMMISCVLATGCKDKQPEPGDEPPAAAPEAAKVDLGAAAAPEAAVVDLGAAAGEPLAVTMVYMDTAVVGPCELPDTDVFFKFDSAKLTPEATVKLDALAECAKADKLGGKDLVVVGRASPSGSDEYNKELGMSRADAVQKYLTEKGVASARVETASEGEEAAPDQLDDQRWPYARRVDIKLGD